MRRELRVRRIVGIAAAMLGLMAPAAMGATVVNGNFETGTLSGWTTNNQLTIPGQTASWVIGSNPILSPLSSHTMTAIQSGLHEAVSDTQGPDNSQILYQDVPLEYGYTHMLSGSVWYNNYGGPLTSPASLDVTTPNNQQYRGDVINPAAPIRSVAPTDILAPWFNTVAGGSNDAGGTGLANLSAFAGTTVRLRLAQVDNQGFLIAQADNIQIASTPLVGFTPCTITRTGAVTAVTVAAGQIVCLYNATVSGLVTVRPGGGLRVVGSSLSAGIASNGANIMTICNSHLSGTMNINSGGGLVEIGNPMASGGECLGNTSTGALNLGSNRAGVEVANNHLAGLTLMNNTGAPNNTVEGNIFTGRLTCKNNHPVPTNNGNPNTGPVGFEPTTGECSGL